MIVETTIHAVSVKGQATQFRFAIDAPVKIDEESWGCALTMPGLTGCPHHIVGVDAWQSLLLAIRLVEQTLTYFVEDGGRLYWEPGGEPMNVGDVIPRFVSAK